jgi:hypothetical protein
MRTLPAGSARRITRLTSAALQDLAAVDGITPPALADAVHRMADVLRREGARHGFGTRAQKRRGHHQEERGEQGDAVHGVTVAPATGCRECAR